MQETRLHKVQLIELGWILCVLGLVRPCFHTKFCVACVSCVMGRGILQQWREQLTIATPEDTQVWNILELSVMFQACLFALIAEGLSLLIYFEIIAWPGGWICRLRGPQRIIGVVQVRKKGSACSAGRRQGASLENQLLSLFARCLAATIML